MWGYFKKAAEGITNTLQEAVQEAVGFEEELSPEVAARNQQEQLYHEQQQKQHKHQHHHHHHRDPIDLENNNDADDNEAWPDIDAIGHAQGASTSSTAPTDVRRDSAAHEDEAAASASASSSSHHAGEGRQSHGGVRESARHVTKETKAKVAAIGKGWFGAVANFVKAVQNDLGVHVGSTSAQFMRDLEMDAVMNKMDYLELYDYLTDIVDRVEAFGDEIAAESRRYRFEMGIEEQVGLTPTMRECYSDWELGVNKSLSKAHEIVTVKVLNANEKKKLKQQQQQEFQKSSSAAAEAKGEDPAEGEEDDASAQASSPGSSTSPASTSLGDESAFIRPILTEEDLLMWQLLQKRILIVRDQTLDTMMAFLEMVQLLEQDRIEDVIALNDKARSNKKAQALEAMIEEARRNPTYAAEMKRQAEQEVQEDIDAAAAEECGARRDIQDDEELNYDRYAHNFAVQNSMLLQLAEEEAEQLAEVFQLKREALDEDRKHELADLVKTMQTEFKAIRQLFVEELNEHAHHESLLMAQQHEQKRVLEALLVSLDTLQQADEPAQRERALQQEDSLWFSMMDHFSERWDMLVADHNETVAAAAEADRMAEEEAELVRQAHERAEADRLRVEEEEKAAAEAEAERLRVEEEEKAAAAAERLRVEQAAMLTPMRGTTSAHNLSVEETPFRSVMASPMGLQFANVALPEDDVKRLFVSEKSARNAIIDAVKAERKGLTSGYQQSAALTRTIRLPEAEGRDAIRNEQIAALQASARWFIAEMTALAERAAATAAEPTAETNPPNQADGAAAGGSCSSSKGSNTTGSGTPTSGFVDAGGSSNTTSAVVVSNGPATGKTSEGGWDNADDDGFESVEDGGDDRVAHAGHSPTTAAAAAENVSPDNAPATAQQQQSAFSLPPMPTMPSLPVLPPAPSFTPSEKKADGWDEWA